MKEQLISVITALIFAFVGVVLEKIWPTEFRAIDSLYFGLFAYLTTTSAVILWNTSKLKKFDKLTKEMEFVANHLRVQESIIKKGTHSFDLFWSISLLRAKEGIYELLDTGDFIVNREEAPNFWLQAIINTDSSWLSTNIIIPEQDWNSGWEYKGLSYQQLSVKLSNTIIKRIFIYETKNNISEEMISVMEEHKSKGIQARWVTTDTNNMYWASFESIEEKLQTVDFIIVDNSYLLSFHFNDKKELNYIKCTRNEKLISNINSLYVRLWERANRVKEPSKKFIRE